MLRWTVLCLFISIFSSTSAQRDCTDLRGRLVSHGIHYVPGPDTCTLCVCDNGVPLECKAVLCSPPQDCRSFRVGVTCCEFICLDDVVKPAEGGEANVRVAAGGAAAVVLAAVLLLVYRVRRQKRRRATHADDQRSLTSIGYISGSMAYMSGTCETALGAWKPGGYLPRGEAPPPYDEVVAQCRAENARLMSEGPYHRSYPATVEAMARPDDLACNPHAYNMPRPLQQIPNPQNCYNAPLLQTVHPTEVREVNPMPHYPLAPNMSGLPHRARLTGSLGAISGRLSVPREPDHERPHNVPGFYTNTHLHTALAMDGDEEAVHRRLISEEMARKEEELSILEQLGREAGSSPMRPRFSLARSPPPRAGPAVTPPPAKAGTKRLLTSPEEVQEALRKRVGSNRHSAAPPLGGIVTSGPRAPAPSVALATPAAPRGRARSPTPTARAATVTAPTATPAGRPAPAAETPASSRLDKAALVDAVHAAVRGIGAVANGTNKLNIADKTSIAAYGQDVLALVAQLMVRLGDAEHEIVAMKLQQATSRQAEAPSAGAPVAWPQQSEVPARNLYANALKMPKGKPPMQVAQQGPTVIFYPETGSTIKTSDETKKALQTAVKPAESGIKVTQVRRVGNSGVVVRTATEESARKLREAVPAGLRVAVPKVRSPRVALRYIRAQLTGDELLSELHRINLADDSEWPASRFQAECTFGVSKQMGARYLVILECSPALRDKLVGLGRVYIGWDEADVSDHLRVTCCSKCQQYGHPEKYCRASDVTCGKCGEAGHRHTECKSETKCCATCRRFKRADAAKHTTASALCPARLHAEQQEASKYLYR